MKTERHHRIAAIGLAILAGMGTAGAQEAAGPWRCGNTYSDRPCPGGRTLALESGPSPEQRRDAELGTRRAQAAADRMERDRTQHERAARSRSSLIHLPGPAPRATAAETDSTLHPPKGRSKGKKASAPDAFIAAAPGSTTKKKSMARSTESGGS